jgi:hypothetical protein
VGIIATTTMETRIGIATVILGVTSVEENKSCSGGLSHERRTGKGKEKASMQYLLEF